MIAHLEDAAAEMAASTQLIATGDSVVLEASRRPESRVVAHAHPQRRLRRKPPIHSRDHDRPDMALDAGAV